MNQPGVVLAAGESNIPHAQSVGFISGERFPFGHVHLVICRGIEDRPGIEFGQRALHFFAVADIQRAAFEAAQLHIRAASAPRTIPRPAARTIRRQRLFSSSADFISASRLPMNAESRPVGAKDDKQNRGQHEHRDKPGPRQPRQAGNRAATATPKLPLVRAVSVASTFGSVASRPASRRAITCVSCSFPARSAITMIPEFGLVVVSIKLRSQRFRNVLHGAVEAALAAGRNHHRRGLHHPGNIAQQADAAFGADLVRRCRTRNGISGQVMRLPHYYPFTTFGSRDAVRRTDRGSPG